MDGDACFTVILSNKGKKITLSFEITLHIKDIAILHRIKHFFNCGNVTSRPSLNRATYRVTKIEDIKNIIIPHFLTFPL